MLEHTEDGREDGQSDSSSGGGSTILLWEAGEAGEAVNYRAGSGNRLRASEIWAGQSGIRISAFQ